MSFTTARSYVSDVARRAPALLILGGLLNGILASSFIQPWEMVLASAMGIALIFAVFLDWRRTCKVALFSLVGLMTMHVNETALKRRAVACVEKDHCGLEVEGIVVDPRCVGAELDWLPNPSWIKFDLKRYRFSPLDRWLETNGRVALRLSRDADGVSYGDKLRLRGYLKNPSPAVFQGAFDFKNYLESRGISRIFVADGDVGKPLDGGATSGLSGFNRQIVRLLRIRDQLLVGLTSEVESPRRKGILAALIFGCRQGLNWRDRREFLMSGVIHLFAISGLHVGMLALTLFWATRWISFRTRHLLVPLLLLLYVATIGFQPSAVRAFIMIATWSICRAFLLVPNPINTVALAAAMILLVSPFSLFDAGFQYSFVAVGFLTLSWRSTRGLVEEAVEKAHWIPAACARWERRLGFHLTARFVRALAAVTVAYLATLGVTLFHRGLRVPFAMAVNLLLAPWVWVLFVACLVKIAVCNIPILNDALAWCVNCALGVLINVVEFTAANGFSNYAPRAPIWTLPIYYAALLTAMVGGRRRWVVVAMTIVCLTLIFWNAQGSFESGRVAVFHGGESQKPTVVILPPREMEAVMINASSSTSVRAAVNYCALHGVDAVDTLLVTRNRKAFCGGCWRLFGGYPVKRMILNEDFRKSGYAKQAVRLAMDNGCETVLKPVRFQSSDPTWSVADPDLRALMTNDGWTVVVDKPEFTATVELVNDGSGTRLLSIDFGDGRRKAFALTNQREPTMIEAIDEK